MTKYRVYGHETSVLYYDEDIEADSKEEAYDIFLDLVVKGMIYGIETDGDSNIKVVEIKDEQ